jgi:hypothetical protein
LLAEARQLQADLDGLALGDLDGRKQLLLRAAAEFVPQEFADWLQVWASDPDGGAVLCVHAEEPTLSALPWANLLLPVSARPDQVWVIRVCKPSGDGPQLPPEKVRLLLAGWQNLTGYAMPGVQRELDQIKQKIESAALEVRVLPDPTRQVLLKACADFGAGVLHLSPPSLIQSGNDLAVPVTPEAGSRGPNSPRLQALPLPELCDSLKRVPGLGLVVLNACNAGLGGCGYLARTLGVAAVGWPSLVTDDTAADLSFFCYQRLLEGMSLVGAVRGFAQAIWAPQAPVEFPVVWLPSPEWVGWSPVRKGPQEPRPGPQGDEAPVPGPSPPPAEKLPSATAGARAIELEFRPCGVINPAMLVTDLSPIERIGIIAPGPGKVNLTLVCDTGFSTSTYRRTVTLDVAGLNPVDQKEVDAIHFPALHELMDRRARRRRVSFTATLTDEDGRELAGQTRTAIWMGANEWLNQEGTWAFIPALVNPFDEGVLTVFAAATRVLRTIAHPADDFTGYDQPTRSPAGPGYVDTQVRAIYQTLRDDANGLNYFTPPGSPVFDAKTRRAIGQVIRTHREVVERRFGTCHDLALLLAACAEYIGIRPLIVLLPGHTVVGYWTAAQHQKEYWEPRHARESKLPTLKFGVGWTFTDGADLVRLVDEGKVKIVEATHLCKRGMQFEEACSYWGQKHRNEPIEVVIDVYAARHKIQPI